jgi:uncharacterized membrane protein YedE/YeeE
MKHVSAFVCGWLFASGLGMAGMTRPSKIIGFLDVAGSWDPTLLIVMAGAVGAASLLFPWVLKREQPIWEPRFQVPEKRAIDARLLTGAALFGIGWGLSGYCPGPALVSLVSFKAPIWAFVMWMVIGLVVGPKSD